MQKLRGVAVAARRSPTQLQLRRPRGAATPRSARTTCRPRRSCSASQRELRGGEEQLPITVAAPAARAARRAARRRGRARRGPRRRDGAALAVLHAGARRRDHGLRHPRPRRVGAPHRLRQRGVAVDGQADRVIEVEWDNDAPGSFVVSVEVEALDRSRLLRDVADVLVRAPREHPRPARRRPSPTASPGCASSSSSPTRAPRLGAQHDPPDRQRLRRLSHPARQGPLSELTELSAYLTHREHRRMDVDVEVAGVLRMSLIRSASACTHPLRPLTGSLKSTTTEPFVPRAPA